MSETSKPDAVAPIPEGEYKHDSTAPVGLMQKVSETIAYFQNVLNRFGDSCVYIRPGGVSWGAVALNREYDDKQLGVPGSDLDRVSRQLRDLSKRHENVVRCNRERFDTILALQSTLAQAEQRAEKAEAENTRLRADLATGGRLLKDTVDLFIRHDCYPLKAEIEAFLNPDAL